MTREKELTEKLVAKMTRVIVESKHVPEETARHAASEAHKQMAHDVRQHKDQLKQRLMEKQRAVLVSIGSEFNKPEYKHLFDRIAERILRAFEMYAGSKDTRRIAETYPARETEIISNFLAAVPRSTGKVSAVANDLLDGQLQKVLQEEGVELSPEDRASLISAVQDMFRLYAGMRKAGFDDVADIQYDEAEQQILVTLRSLLNRSRNSEAEFRLKQKISEALKGANLPLSEYQVTSVRDQLLWLFQSYVQAPDNKKDLVYELGEDRIIFALFDPHFIRGSLRATGR